MPLLVTRKTLKVKLFWFLLCFTINVFAADALPKTKVLPDSKAPEVSDKINVNPIARDT